MMMGYDYKKKIVKTVELLDKPYVPCVYEHLCQK